MGITKTCNTCGATKPITDFYRQSSKKDGYQNRCKVCANIDVTSRLTKSKNRRYQLVSKYGLTPAEYDALLKKQDNCCAICKEPLTSSRNVHVDHDHTFGYTRGILCRGCNQGLGNFRENKEALMNAITYLEEWEV